MTGKHWVEAWKAAHCKSEARLDVGGLPTWTTGDVALRCDGFPLVEIRIKDHRGRVVPIKVERDLAVVVITVED